MADKNAKRKEGTKQLTLWVDEQLLDRWDSFRSRYGVNRTSMIIAAVNEYMERHGSSQVPDTQDSIVIKTKLSEIQDVLKQRAEDATIEQQAIIDSPENRDRVLKLLEMQASKSERIAFITKIDEMLVIEILTALKELDSVYMDKEWVWHVNKE